MRREVAPAGPSGCPKPTRPQGSPPHGTRARSASLATQTAADHTGAAGSRETSAMPAPPSPTNSDSSTTSATHGTGPDQRADPREQRQQETHAEQEAVAETRLGRRPYTSTPSTRRARAARATRTAAAGSSTYSSTPAPTAAATRASDGGRGPAATRGRRSGIGGRCGHNKSVRRAPTGPPATVTAPAPAPRAGGRTRQVHRHDGRCRLRGRRSRTVGRLGRQGWAAAKTWALPSASSTPGGPERRNHSRP